MCPKTPKTEPTREINLAKHKWALHEEFKYAFRYCDYQATSKDDLAEHNKTVAEGVRYTCR